MIRSLKITTVAGIGLYLHWTLLAVAAFLLAPALLSFRENPLALGQVFFFGAIFSCVALHELDHALAARRYGVGTRRITLLPIGGIAELERLPESPKAELWIALSGPLVNLVIGICLFAGGVISVGIEKFLLYDSWFGGFVRDLTLANLAMVVFNLIPALPMDGGRVLRAILAMTMPARRATRFAATVGRTLAVAFVIVGLFVLSQPILAFIGAFVFIAAGAEEKFAELRHRLAGHTVREVVQHQFSVFPADTPIPHAFAHMLVSPQRTFPVVEDGRCVGLISRQDLERLGPDGSGKTQVSDVMQACETLSPDDGLHEVAVRMSGDQATWPVSDRGQLVGIVTRESLAIFLRSSAA